MPWRGQDSASYAKRGSALRANLEAILALTMLALCVWAVSEASAGSEATRLIRAEGRIVAIPASVPHEAGDMVDRRIVPDLKWLAAHYPIYVTDGYSGPLPSGTHAGCNRCHTRNSDHYNGLAVDIVPVGGGNRCDKTWRAITRLARWAEPLQNQPRPPFRWVGYERDAGHGCGNHLHLSWNHAPAREYQLAEWVEVLSSHPTTAPPKPSEPAPRHVKGPMGGMPQVNTGGLEARRYD